MTGKQTDAFRAFTSALLPLTAFSRRTRKYLLIALKTTDGLSDGRKVYVCVERNRPEVFHAYMTYQNGTKRILDRPLFAHDAHIVRRFAEGYPNPPDRHKGG